MTTAPDGDGDAHRADSPGVGLLLSRLLDVPPGARIVVAGLVGVVVAATFTWEKWVMAALSGWAAAGFVHTVWVLATVVPMGPQATSEHALREEPTRAVSYGIVLLACLASLVGMVVVLVGGGIHDRAMMTAVLAAIVMSWASLHTLFALRYARLYYTPPVGGVDFHQDAPPRYTDFTYMAITVGMSFAVSDTDLASSRFRQSAQLQAMLAYVFGTVVLALLVNLVSGLVS